MVLRKHRKLILNKIKIKFLDFVFPILNPKTKVLRFIPDYILLRIGILSNYYLTIKKLKIHHPIPNQHQGEKKVVFFRMSFVPRMQTFELALANNLAASGYKIQFYYCSPVLRICSAMDIYYLSGQNIKTFCQSCFYNNSRIANIIPFDNSFLAAYISEKDISDAHHFESNFDVTSIMSFKVDGTDFGDELFLTISKFLTSSKIEYTKENILVIKKFVYSSFLVIRAIKSIIKINKPNKAILVCGHIFWFGFAFKLLKENGIEVITYDETNIDSTSLKWIINNESPCVDINLTNEWNTFKNDELLQNKITKIEILIKEREKYFLYDKTITTTPFIKNAEISSYNKIFSLFTNLSWDSTVVGKNSIFTNQLEWINQTIDFFSSYRNVCLIIRIHPAEHDVYGMKTKEKLIDEISKYHPSLPNNIKVIAPSEKVNSYDIMNISDYVIIYASNIGLEAILKGKSVIIVGKPHFYNKDLAIEPKSIDEYLHLLFYCIEFNISSPSSYQNAIKYAYLCFIDELFEAELFLNVNPFDSTNLKISCYEDFLQIDTFKKIILWMENRRYQQRGALLHSYFS